MPFLIKGRDEIDGILKVINRIDLDGLKSSRYREILSCLLSINYSERGMARFMKHKSTFIEAVGTTARLAFKRADRLYSDNPHRVTKPNYWKRINEFDDVTYPSGELHI